jgi:broad specificity phosphatase PhoE
VGVLVLVRHGQTAWSATGRHTSRTDIDLTPDGEQQANDLGKALTGRQFAAVVSSPRRRAMRTAELAGLSVTSVDTDLVEWDYGRYEGITTDRIDRVIERARPLLAQGDVALVAHGHALRVVGARWIGQPTAVGGRLRLDTATISTLGHEHDRQVILEWNRPVS